MGGRENFTIEITCPHCNQAGAVVWEENGVGYRQNFAWSFQALYIWNGTRNAGSGAFVQESHAINIRVIRSF